MNKAIWERFVFLTEKVKELKTFEKELNDFKVKYRNDYEEFSRQPITEENLRVLGFKQYKTPEGLIGWRYKDQNAALYFQIGWGVYKIAATGRFESTQEVSTYLSTIGQVIVHSGIKVQLELP